MYFYAAFTTLLLIIAFSSASAQTYSVIHTFTGSDGANPYGGVTLDSNGDLFGTTTFGGTYGSGTVYELSREGSSWNLSSLYSFGRRPGDGAAPLSRVVFGPGGNLYGTTYLSQENQNGTVFQLVPSSCNSGQCVWTETVIHAFEGSSGADGAQPQYGDLVFDLRGNIYGTTLLGGLTSCSCGTVFQITQVGTAWDERVIYSFGAFGSYPYGSVTFDDHGGLYGITSSDYSAAQAYKLTSSGTTWLGASIHGFYDPGEPSSTADLTRDAAGNFYGTTDSQGVKGGGFAFELSPSTNGWTYEDIFDFDPRSFGAGTLTLGPDGSLYGAVANAPPMAAGFIFKLTRNGNSWIFKTLHQFTGEDGENPTGTLAVDSDGVVYGTTEIGGTGGCPYGGCGVVFKITQ